MVDTSINKEEEEHLIKKGQNTLALLTTLIRSIRINVKPNNLRKISSSQVIEQLYNKTHNLKFNVKKNLNVKRQFKVTKA